MGCAAKAFQTVKRFWILMLVMGAVTVIITLVLLGSKRPASAGGKSRPYDDEWYQKSRSQEQRYQQNGHRRRERLFHRQQTSGAEKTYRQVMAAAKASKSMSKLHAVFLDGVARGARLNLKEWSRSMTLEELCQFIAGKPGAKYRQTTLLVHPDKFDAKRVPENEREFRTELFEVLSAKKKEQEQSGRHP